MKQMETKDELQRYEERLAFMAVAVPVLGTEGARVLVAEMNGAYLIGLDDYNQFSVEIIPITKPLYDALIENAEKYYNETFNTKEK